MAHPFCTSFTRRGAFHLASAAFLSRIAKAGNLPAATDTAGSIPPRSPQALTGTQFAESIASKDRQQREHAILSQILEGNLPGFLRKLAPVKIHWRQPSIGGKTLTATIFAMPEYLAIGSDRDFLRIPMDLHTAMAVANRFGLLLPTRKIVDAIYQQAVSRFTPQPLPPGPEMTSTRYYRRHNELIEEQSNARGFATGQLSAGHKKDVVISNRLQANAGRIAIYGWHRDNGQPIQPLSTVHGSTYADYSHGIRLIGAMAMIEDRLRPVWDILRDSVSANVLSDEGVLYQPAV